MNPVAAQIHSSFGPCRVAFCGVQPGSVTIPSDVELAWNRQVHGTEVLEAQARGEQGCADGLVTRVPGLALVVQTADCVPVLLFGGGQIAAVHAGWRGLAAGVIERACEQLPDVEHAWIGPAIGPCCYEVGPEVAEAFAGESAGHLRPGPGDRTMLDLPGIASDRLAGRAEVELLRACTRCDERWWSYRRSLAEGSADGARRGRNLSLIWLETT